MQRGEATLSISVVVLAELFYVLAKHGQSDLFPKFIETIELSLAYCVESLTVNDIQHLPTFSEIPEMHDRLIAIQAKRLGATVLTRDSALQSSPQVDWLW